MTAIYQNFVRISGFPGRSVTVTALFRRLRLLLILIFPLFVTGCVQMSLDDISQPKIEIPAKLSSKMRALGMKADSPVLVRIFKMESELEVWKVNGSGKYALLKTYPICRWSGKLGPKTKIGDRQAPEGFYHVSRGMLNPKSQFYLSFNLGYPNRLKSALGYTGEALMVHGACSSSGCFALTDQGVSEIYALAHFALAGGQERFQVQSFPFRMTPKNLADNRNDPNFGFWQNLKQGYDIFEVTRRQPQVAICGKRYVFDAQFEETETLDPLAACPAVLNTQDPLVAAKAAKDNMAFSDLVSRSQKISTLAYQDGGMNPAFRKLLKNKGAKDLAENTSLIKYPISRPEAALADPFATMF